MKLNNNQSIFIQGETIELESFTKYNITDEYISWLNDSVVFKYSNQRFFTHDLLSCKKYLKSFKDTQNLFLIIKVKKTSVFIGTLTVYLDLDHGVADIGIMIGNRDEWGKGYGQDAWDSILFWLLNNQKVRKITAGTLSCNIAMRNIIERSGMKIEGVRNQQEMLNGEPQDVILFAILNKDN
jgi:[ribosomal protein S5]-alanine N-acetyltransferase